MEKFRRQSALRNLLRDTELSNQSQVVLAMANMGFEVTQSSISRDFYELGVVKHGGRYVVLGRDSSSRVLEVLPAGPNLLVVKTREGEASAVGAIIDRMESEDILGTVAGDDTLFVATLDADRQKRAMKLLKSLS